jgi:hypothetical protein
MSPVSCSARFDVLFKLKAFKNPSDAWAFLDEIDVVAGGHLSFNPAKNQGASMTYVGKLGCTLKALHEMSQKRAGANRRVRGPIKMLQYSTYNGMALAAYLNREINRI